MSSFLRQSLAGPIVRRALLFALVVGTILVSINHGDAIIAGDIDQQRILKIALTVVVPYLVSTISSVGTFRQIERDNRSQKQVPAHESSQARALNSPEPKPVIKNRSE